MGVPVMEILQRADLYGLNRLTGEAHANLNSLRLFGRHNRKSAAKTNNSCGWRQMSAPYLICSFITLIVRIGHGI